MYGFITFFIVIIIPSLYSETLLELEKLSSNPLYFNVPVSEYRIEPKCACQNGKVCPASLGIAFSTRLITVITDRPIRKASHVDTDEFITYTTSTEKSGLVFTLDISQNGKVIPTNFRVDSVTYDKKKNAIVAQIKMDVQDDDLIHQLNSTGSAMGGSAVLSVEG